MFKGSIVALITPMNKYGNIDIFSLKKLINYHIKNNTSAIVSVGTTGESATLNHKEHVDLILQTLEIADNKIPIIASTGANSTNEAIFLTQCFNNTGIKGCLTVAPYYNKPTQEGLYQHFKKIAENTDLPQILYNIPSRTGCDILPKTVARLSKIKNIIAIKEATGDLSRVNQIKSLISGNKSFSLLSGDDSTGLDFIQLGGNGIISVTANIAAKQMSEMCYLACNKQFHKARLLNNQFMCLHKNLFIETNPIPIKWACKKLGLILHDIVRLPLTQLQKKFEIKLKQSLIDTGLL